MTISDYLQMSTRLLILREKTCVAVHVDLNSINHCVFFEQKDD